jgi:amidohydrolase
MDLLTNTIKLLQPDLIETRHYLHQYPELSEYEENTSNYVAERLRGLGLDARTGVGGYGVLAEIKGRGTGKTLAIRADFDALPIQEENEVPYRSVNSGVMHACGHDGHTSILLGTANALIAHRDEFKGTVRLLFQPAEETVGGAKRMCEEGAMEGVDAVIGLHGWPFIGIGQIGVRTGAMMASADTFDIIIKGKGGHAAYPHATVDPIVVGAQVVQALQTIASREIDPSAPIVVTVTQFHSGTAYNVIPGTAKLCGTYRTLSADVRKDMPERIRRISEGICTAHRTVCDITFKEGTPPVVNDGAIMELISRVGSDVLGSENVISVPHSSMGAEDFAVYLGHAPGAMFRLGLGNVSPIHTPTFNFADEALTIGVELFVRIALRYLEEK